MSLLQRHIILPSLAPLLFFAVATTPVELLGCRTRGLLAVSIALASVLAGLGAAIMAIKGRLQGDSQSHWWVGSALILAVPAVGVLVLA
jgi:hypothetical protein